MRATKWEWNYGIKERKKTRKKNEIKKKLKTKSDTTSTSSTAIFALLNGKRIKLPEGNPKKQQKTMKVSREKQTSGKLFVKTLEENWPKKSRQNFKFKKLYSNFGILFYFIFVQRKMFRLLSPSPHHHFCCCVNLFLVLMPNQRKVIIRGVNHR